MQFRVNNQIIDVKDGVIHITTLNKNENIILKHISSLEITKSCPGMSFLSFLVISIGSVLYFFESTIGFIILGFGLLFMLGFYFGYETLTLHVIGRGKVNVIGFRNTTTKLYDHLSDLLKKQVE